jgi:hypothetical protein
MTKWEYMVENWTLASYSSNREEFEQELNEYGEDGWELVAIIPQANDGLGNSIFSQLVFKREVFLNELEKEEKQ